ncbi:hypothetical protein WJX73_008828 [Symbiochloris irregularis]|uniref:Inner centromere protein ARK-binding domain-containing protein n=1 Tax=Symbiochloris irregularis TaxID=706552 RepID=A0AAW1NZ42_9CHLO
MAACNVDLALQKLRDVASTHLAKLLETGKDFKSWLAQHGDLASDELQHLQGPQRGSGSKANKENVSSGKSTRQGTKRGRPASKLTLPPVIEEEGPLSDQEDAAEPVAAEVEERPAVRPRRQPRRQAKAQSSEPPTEPPPKRAPASAASRDTDQEAVGSPEAYAPQLDINLVSSIRSFLPTGAAKMADGPPAKKPVRVKALEAAEAARRKDAGRAAERMKQKENLEQQKADRARHAQEVKARQEEEAKRRAAEAKRLEQVQQKREEEAAAQRKAREEAEKRERREKQQRLDEARQRRQLQQQQQEQAARAQPLADKKKVPAEEERKRKAAAIAQEIEMKRVKAAAAPQPAAASQHPLVSPHPLKAGTMEPPSFPARVTPAASHAPSRLQHASFAHDPVPGSAAPAPSAQVQPIAVSVAQAQASMQRKTPAADRVKQQEQSYQISPYRGSSDEESEDEETPPDKPIPSWARGKELMGQLLAQLSIDPDEVFQQRQRTCALDDMFSAPVRPQPGKRDLKERRTSTSNWIEDRVTWQEEKQYKQAMGYLKAGPAQERDK